MVNCNRCMKVERMEMYNIKDLFAVKNCLQSCPLLKIDINVPTLFQYLVLYAAMGLLVKIA